MTPWFSDPWRDEDDDGAYPLDSPKHPTFHERYAEMADRQLKRLKEEQLEAAEPPVSKTCPGCGLTLAGDEEPGEEFCAPETSPDCWTLTYSSPGARRRGPFRSRPMRRREPPVAEEGQA